MPFSIYIGKWWPIFKYQSTGSTFHPCRCLIQIINLERGDCTDTTSPWKFKCNADKKVFSSILFIINKGLHKYANKWAHKLHIPVQVLLALCLMYDVSLVLVGDNKMKITCFMCLCLAAVNLLLQKSCVQNMVNMYTTTWINFICITTNEISPLKPVHSSGYNWWTQQRAPSKVKS